MSNLAERMAEQAAFTARYDALSAIGRLAHELGASIETSEDIDEALAYCAARQERMDALQLRTLDEARADANEDAAQRTMVDTDKPAHALDIMANLRVVWVALETVREDLIPEGDPNYDAQWDEITSAMAVITEELGLDPREV